MNKRFLFLSLTRIADFTQEEIVLKKQARRKWNNGDYVACQVAKPPGRMKVEMTCGRMAGKYAAAAVAANDMTILKAYDREWQDLFGKTLTRAHLRRKQMESRWSEFDTIVRQCWIAYWEYYV